jgi:hypothetical protein
MGKLFDMAIYGMLTGIAVFSVVDAVRIISEVARVIH